jgi:hypothetical protein
MKRRYKVKFSKKLHAEERGFIAKWILKLRAEKFSNFRHEMDKLLAELGEFYREGGNPLGDEFDGMIHHTIWQQYRAVVNCQARAKRLFLKRHI